jgi:hypothetical protein
MISEEELTRLLVVNQELLVTHKKECPICPVTSYECKTNIILHDRINLIKLILV